MKERQMRRRPKRGVGAPADVCCINRACFQAETLPIWDDVLQVPATFMRCYRQRRRRYVWAVSYLHPKPSSRPSLRNDGQLIFRRRNVKQTRPCSQSAWPVHHPKSVPRHRLEYFEESAAFVCLVGTPCHWRPRSRCDVRMLAERTHQNRNATHQGQGAGNCRFDIGNHTHSMIPKDLEGPWNSGSLTVQPC